MGLVKTSMSIQSWPKCRHFIVVCQLEFYRPNFRPFPRAIPQNPLRIPGVFPKTPKPLATREKTENTKTSWLLAVRRVPPQEARRLSLFEWSVDIAAINLGNLVVVPFQVTFVNVHGGTLPKFNLTREELPSQ